MEKKTFSWLIAGWKQIGVIAVVLLGGWWSKTYSPESWELVKPHIVEAWAAIGGFVGVWDAATVAVKNKAREIEAKK